MCGIAGFLDTSDKQYEPESILSQMGQAIASRGPDSYGLWWHEQEGLGFSHRRLSIIDLSAEGHQPMHSSTGRYCIVFNGEIYNFQSIRDDLEKSGCSFRGHSDTEVMLAAFETWGFEASIQRFVGMFAFALYDNEERELLLVRDRLGEKPLYFGKFDNFFVFGSELKALSAHPKCPKEINQEALAYYLRLGYLPSPFSIINGVEKLKPGHFLRFKLKSQEIRTHCYWDPVELLEKGQSDLGPDSEQAALDELERLLRLSVREKMIADVPLGAFLSGGTDSSLIVALMQQESSSAVKTFTIGFDDPVYNEAEHAKSVAEFIGTEHTEWYITPEDALSTVPLLPQICDEPFADPSIIPTYLVSKLTREHVTVCLSGDAGDELFAGYNRYHLSSSLWRYFSRFPKSLRGLVAKRLAASNPQTLNRFGAVLSPAASRLGRKGAMNHKLKKIAELLPSSSLDMLYDDMFAHWLAPSELLSYDFSYTPLSERAAGSELAPSAIEKMMYIDLCSYLPDDILVKMDRASMAVSLEGRIPMLDHRFVEFAWSLPLSLKTRKDSSKYLLKQLLYRHVPKELMERPKRGFGVPLAEWLRGPLRDWAGDLISSSRLEQDGFFDTPLVEKVFQEHLSEERNHADKLWTLLMFQSWWEDFRTP